MFETFDIAQLKATCLTFGLGCLRGMFFLGICFIGVWIELLPISERWSHYWPMWSALVVLIWSAILSNDSVIAYAWLLGLILDGLYGNKLGTHAIGLGILAYLSHILQLPNATDTSERITQLIWVFSMCVMYQLLIWVLQRLTYIPVSPLGQRLWVPPLFTTLLWFCLVDVIRVGYETLTSEHERLRQVFARR